MQQEELEAIRDQMQKIEQSGALGRSRSYMNLLEFFKSKFFHSLVGTKTKLGASVVLVSRDEYCYTLGSKRCMIYAELQSGVANCIVSASCFERWDDGTAIPVDFRQKISADFIEFLESLGWHVVLR